MSRTKRRVLLSVGAALLTLAASLAAVWLTSYNVLAEGADTPLARRLWFPWSIGFAAANALRVYELPGVVIILGVPIAAWSLLYFALLSAFRHFRNTSQRHST